MSSDATEDKLIEAFLKSKLYGELWKRGWRLMYGKTVDDLCRRARHIPRKYVPRGVKGFVLATEGDKR